MRGNITRRGKASWRIKFEVSPGPDGKRRSQFVTVRGSKKDAYAKLSDQLAAIGKGTFVEPTKLIVGDHVEARIGTWHAAGDVGDATRQRYRVLLKKHIAPHLGGVAVQRLTRQGIEAWHPKMRAAGLSPRTIKHAHALLERPSAMPFGMVF